MGNTVQISAIKTVPYDPKEEESQEKKNFTCEICIEPMSWNMKFNNSSDKKCAHHFCIDCMAKYIQVKVEEHAAADVECPGLNCNEYLDPLSCRPLIGIQLFNKWCDNLCDAALLRFDRKCYCPYQDCSALVVNECGGTLKKSECPNCKRLFCFQCKIPWHSGYKCEDSWRVGDTNDILFGQLVEREKWNRCPRCRYFVERIFVGCNIVLCTCHIQFCYNCGKIYYRGHKCVQDPTEVFLAFLSIIILLVLNVFAFIALCKFSDIVREKRKHG